MERIEEASAGDIVGVMGLKDSSTGETLCSASNPVPLERMEFYKPVISIAIEPKSHADQEKLEDVLKKFTMEDQLLRSKLMMIQDRQFFQEWESFILRL